MIKANSEEIVKIVMSTNAARHLDAVDVRTSEVQVRVFLVDLESRQLVTRVAEQIKYTNGWAEGRMSDLESVEEQEEAGR